MSGTNHKSGRTHHPGERHGNTQVQKQYYKPQGPVLDGAVYTTSEKISNRSRRHRHGLPRFSQIDKRIERVQWFMDVVITFLEQNPELYVPIPDAREQYYLGEADLHMHPCLYFISACRGEPVTFWAQYADELSLDAVERSSVFDPVYLVMTDIFRIKTIPKVGPEAYEVGATQVVEYMLPIVKRRMQQHLKLLTQLRYYQRPSYEQLTEQD